MEYTQPQPKKASGKTMETYRRYATNGTAVSASYTGLLSPVHETMIGKIFPFLVIMIQRHTWISWIIP